MQDRERERENFGRFASSPKTITRQDDDEQQEKQHEDTIERRPFGIPFFDRSPVYFLVLASKCHFSLAI